MKSSFGNRDFENFVRHNADQYRMFPSEDVWKNIHNTLHTRRRWYGAGLAFLLLITASAVTWVMIANPASEKNNKGTAINNLAKTESTTSPVSSVGQKNINTPVTQPGQIPGFTRKSQSNLLEAKNSLTSVLPSSIEPETKDISDELITAVPSGTIHQIFNPTRESIANPVIAKNDNISIDEIKAEEQQAINTALPEKAIANTENAKDNLTSKVQENYPLTIESVTNEFRSRSAGKRILWQFFITPTVSYRQLSASDNSTLRNALGYLPNGSTNVNSVVTHRPDLGLQIGVSAGYPLTKSLKLRGGLQFNLNRYDIKASAYNPELATINLNDAYGSSISAWTNYRNYGGYRTNWLKNFYFSVSAPIGIELQLVKGKKMNWGIAGTVQPTYILKDKAYLISTDYKNYAKIPWLVRRVNLSTGVETFVGFGQKTKWQVGPQVRYQVLSSFNNEYPVKEHLFDFGLKVGVFLNK